MYKWDIFKKFACAYLVVLFISLVWGLFNYPYYEQILNGPADQVEKLPWVLAFLHSVGIFISEKTLLEFWMFARPIKGVFFEAFYTFGAAYMIFCWYHERVSRAVDILLKVTTVDLIIIAGYGLVDVCYQSGQMWAQDVLMAVNPILHGGVVLEPVYFGFAPRLFWDSQIRSIFLEPSYFGIYMAFAFPLLWWSIFRENKRWKQAILWLLFTVLAFEIFLTQSRTALAVSLGVFAIFALLCLYRLQKKLLILLAVLCIGCGIGFAGSLEFMKTGQVPSQIGEWTPLATKWQNMQKKAMSASPADAKKVQGNKGNAGVDSKKYLDSNLKSLSGAEIEGAHAGSNHSRFTVQKTHIIIGLEHPLLGVGTTLRNGYLREKLDEDPGAEIQKWNKNIDELGLLREGFALLGDYSLRFAETGFLGLGLYLFPSLILMWTFGKVLIKRRGEASSVFVALAFIGIMATGLGDGINITFCYWMAMALSFLMLGDGDSDYAF